MNGNEFKKLLSHFDNEDVENYFLEECDDDIITKKLTDMGVSVKYVETITNGEDSQASMVVRVTRNGVISHFEFQGWYSSYEGLNLDYNNPIKVKKIPVQSHVWVPSND